MKMMTTKKKYRSYDQNQLKHLADVLCDDIENLLTVLGIDSYKMLDKMVIMSCPIHGGDNDSAFNLYHQGDSYRGNWKCRTHGCETVFKSSIIGFIRGCLSHEQGWTKPGDPVVSFNDAIDFALKYSKYNPSDYKVSKKTKEKNNFVNTVKYLKTETIVTPPQQKVSRATVTASLQIPSTYFISRGFSSEILTKYDVGDCIGSGKEMSNRAVVPVYDIDYTGMVGCTGRSIFNKCTNCGSYHDHDCPNSKEKWLFCKWRHNKNFKTQEHLYNYWFAKEHISKTKTVVLVESPGNVWRLEESGIHNSVAIFGSSMSHKQKMLLDISGAMNIITIMDNDEAGQEAAKQIALKCERTYNIKNIVPPTGDIAEMSTELIKTNIIPQIQDYQ